MKRILRAEGIVAFYVWDYPGGGLEFVRYFWKAATALDRNALDLAEDRRFPFCTRKGLTSLAARAGLVRIESTAIEVPTVFPSFEDYWQPFTSASGPAPGYCASLAPDVRQRLKEKLQASLPRGADGSIPLKARAWAIKVLPR